MSAIDVLRQRLAAETEAEQNRRDDQAGCQQATLGCIRAAVMDTAAMFPTLAQLGEQAAAVVQSCRALSEIEDPEIHELLEPVRTEITKLVLMASLLAERARFA